MNLNWTKLLFTLPFVALNFCILAQPDEDEEDYSSYGTEAGVKRYCTPKVIGLSPQRLISLGYEFAGPQKITAAALGNFPEQIGEVNNYMGLYLSANLPVISTHKFLFNLGMNYVDSYYSFKNADLTNPFLQSLDGNIRTFGLNTTIFKPLNQKHYLLGYLGADYNGDYNLKRMQSIGLTKTTVVGVFGWKFNDRFQFGIGATQTYRAGEKSFLPVIHYNYTSKNDKWGIEALLPARMHYRYAFSKQNMLLAGFEVIGNSYHLANVNNRFPENETPGMIAGYDAKNLEFRRSEVRFRLDYMRQLYQFIWLSVQGGYIYAYRFNVDSGNSFRSIGSDKPYVMVNSMTGTPYFQITLNLVSP